MLIISTKFNIKILEIMADDFKKNFFEQEIELRRLRHLVVRDELTGLYNRRGFFEEVEKLYKEISYQIKHPSQERKHFFVDELAVIFIDIDNFKKINDAHGHAFGDKILKYVSSIINEKIRSVDVAGRIGGEELVIALAGANERDAYKKAEEIRKVIASKVRIPQQKDLHVTVSVGVAELSPRTDLAMLIAHADEAMYEAKTQRGKNTTVKWSELHRKSTS